ncbi:uncharacterized protein L203_101027 [Cryptococcus depauperatus CBS 7841]|uniref:Chloride channel protein n=1 Tax=Cryptococcus depauperatus CBS 7841 TaxID=1295531 RepID=A0A1E3IKH0_9TREE|nr:voltage-gated chloride channel [Cryptococcus depauperatus CBS 7841]
MGEQRVRLSPTPPSTSILSAPSSSTSTTTVRPSRPPSTTSLRNPKHRAQQPNTLNTSGGVTQSRRQSADTYMTDSQSVSPITYFPNPSTFINKPGASSSSTSTSTSTSPSASTFQISSTDSEDRELAAHTPRINPAFTNSVMGLDVTGVGVSSPRMLGRGHSQQSHNTSSSSSVSTLSTDYPRRRSSQAQGGRVFSTPVPGYGATHPNVGLGLGTTLSRSGTGSAISGSGALSSPRRISTSRALPVQPQTAFPTQGLGLPSHEAYYSVSQPATATASRFKDKGSQGNSLRDRAEDHQHSSFGGSSYGATLVPRPPLVGHSSSSPVLSPAGSVIQKLKKRVSAVGLGLGRPEHYDDESLGRRGEVDEMLEDNEGERANGTRVWYSSYVTIDWIHDAIKESSRVRRLRHAASRSLRGKVINTWDRFQGWLVVTLVGVITAFIAFLIIRAEMALFDLKDGFCSSSWGTAKRFCCAPRHQTPGSDGGEGDCADWVEWGQLFDPDNQHGSENAWIYSGPEFLTYAIMALILATVSSCMTVYLSSSVHHTTSKDSAFLTPPQTLPTKHTDASPTKLGVGFPDLLNANAIANERQPLLDSITNEPSTPLIEIPPTNTRKVMFYAAGSGIPEIKTILSGFVIHGYLGGWTLITKSVGLALSVASGLSLGKEGPLVHISCCVGNIISRLFIKYECNEAKRREILSAACAAGVAVAFGAPIGGVLFSLEEVSYYFPSKVMWRSFWCAAITAITFKALNPFGNGSLVLFAVTYTKEYHYWEFLIFLLLGVFGGLYGAVFARLNIIWSRRVRNGTWLKNHPILEVALVVILTTIVSFSNPYTRMGGTELIASLFEECNPSSSSRLCVSHPEEVATVIWEIFMTLVIKGCLTIVTFGIKLPAGIFIPSLAVGACFGRIVGHIMEYIEWTNPELPLFSICKDTNCVVPGLYAVVGAAATLAGVTRTTVSLAVIIFELTSTLNYVVPVMIGVLVAKTLADGLEKKGIYDLVIDLNQLPYLDSKHEYLWGSRRASTITDKSIPHLRADKPYTVRSLTGKLLELVRLGMEDTGFPVLVKEITSAGGGSVALGMTLENGIGSGRERSCLRVVGFLGMNELEHALSELADEPDASINLMPDDSPGALTRSGVFSIFSFADSYVGNTHNPYDLSRYIDQAPIIVQIHSPLELVQQLFVRLGVRQVIVVNSRGVYQGIITKKAWLNFLAELEGED